jgi:hypothetical protein
LGEHADGARGKPVVDEIAMALVDQWSKREIAFYQGEI